MGDQLVDLHDPLVALEADKLELGSDQLESLGRKGFEEVIALVHGRLLPCVGQCLSHSFATRHGRAW